MSNKTSNLNDHNYMDDKLETRVAIAKMDEKINHIDKKVTEIAANLHEFINASDRKFARKEDVAKIDNKINGVIQGLITALFLSVAYLVKIVLFP